MIKIRLKFYFKVCSLCVFAYALSALNASAAIAPILDFGIEQNRQLVAGFGFFVILTLILVIWMTLERKKLSDQLVNQDKQRKYLRQLISARQDNFYLWNARKEVVLSSDIDIKFEDETVPQDLEDLIERFSEADKKLFITNVEKLIADGLEFDQTIDIDHFNMHILLSGNVINLQNEAEDYFVLWIRDITIDEKIQRHQNVEGKEGSEKAKLLENALNSANFPMWIRNKDLSLQWVNKAYVDAVDGESSENVLENDLEIPINTLGVNLRSMSENASLRGENGGESHFVVINGERRSMDFNNILFKNTHRENAVLGYAQDITELEEARGSLADHTESYAETLDKFSSAVAIFDANMRLEYYNKAYVRLWGLPESLLFSHPDYGEILEALREARKLPEQANFPEWKKKQLEAYTEVLDPVETMLHLPDGKTLRVVMQHHPLGGMLIFYEDVTDYFALESSYNTLIAVQRETLDNLHEGIAVFGVDGRLKLFNDGFINIWEVSSEFLKANPHAVDVLDRCAKLLNTTEAVEGFQRLIVGGEVKKEASSGQFELENGKVINYSLVPLPDGAVLVIFIDVTDSYRVEYSLRKHNEALEEAQNIKTDFLAHMSYELRNPLNSVLGFAELLEKEYQGPLNDEQHQYMRNILSASDHLLDLINDILDLSVIEAGGLSIETAEFNLQELINGIVTKLDERIKQKSIEVNVSFDDRLNNVVGDAKRIQHSISNLFSNAIKFTRDAGRIDIETWHNDKNYFVSIKDDGIGIEESETRDIFEKFYTGSNVPKGKGAGLGLSLVKIFIEKHGGEIIVDSKIGIGTEMICKLPKKIPNSDAKSRNPETVAVN